MKILKTNRIAALFITSTLLAACGGGSSDFNDVSTGTNETIATETTEKLSSAEIQSLLFMREEEELARDLYLDIYAAKDNRLNVFKNISDNAETQHAVAMLALLNTYGIEDPSTGQRHTYTNPELQNLYNQLLSHAIGSDDLAALRVGALVEESDIQDIVTDINLISADHQDILETYNNLLCGSRNHLRAFVKQITSLTGEKYVIQVPEISDEVDSILNTAQEQCGQ